MNRLLVIDDDRSVRHTVQRAFEQVSDFEVLTAENGEQGLQMVMDEQPTVCLLDVFLPEHNGLELFPQLRSIDPKLPIIFITGDRSSETAIAAMRAGAFDYLPKPLDLLHLRSLANSAARARRMMDEPVGLPLSGTEPDGEKFIGNSRSMLNVFKDIGRVAAQNVTVLVRGESGCGKELVARALVHHSNRRDKPFVAVNCAAIPDQLLESELFGHEKGAFTGAEKRRVGRFEQVDGGTIFLDEVGDMSALIQGKVLRLLQEQKFERLGGTDLITTNVRIIAATNRPLEDMVEEGDFREDLLYRLNSFTIELPPLRDRRDDISPLLEYFLGRATVEMNRTEINGISPSALKLLLEYDWPGNVRQLQSVVRQSLINTTGTVISDVDLPDFIRTKIGGPSKPKSSSYSGASKEASSTSNASTSDASESTADPTANTAAANSADGAETVEEALPQPVGFLVTEFIQQRLAEGTNNLYDELIEEVERRLFSAVLEHTNGNQSKAAEILGITRGKIRDRIAAFNIQLDSKVTIGSDDANS